VVPLLPVFHLLALPLLLLSYGRYN
jgi:hypothetical protein